MKISEFTDDELTYNNYLDINLLVFQYEKSIFWYYLDLCYCITGSIYHKKFLKRYGKYLSKYTLGKNINISNYAIFDFRQIVK